MIATSAADKISSVFFGSSGSSSASSAPRKKESIDFSRPIRRTHVSESSNEAELPLVVD